jgi:hypothetical protein
MGFGLLLFYALLPLFYAFFGLGIGNWFGSLLTGAPEGEMSLVKLIFGFGGAVFFAGSAGLVIDGASDACSLMPGSFESINGSSLK